MKPDSKQLGVIGHNIVIDNGTNTVKGGFSTADAPQCRIPTLVGHGRHKVRTSPASRLLSRKCWLSDLIFTHFLIFCFPVMGWMLHSTSPVLFPA